jgi:HEAT repeat protein
MLMRGCRQLFLIPTVCFVIAAFVSGSQSIDESSGGTSHSGISSEAEKAATELNRLLSTLEFGGSDTVWALKSMRPLGARASPAIPMLCSKLGDENHSIRSAAIEVLKSIGAESIVPLRQRLQSPSGRVRAAVVTALFHLKSIEFEEFDQLALDPDVRVRAAAARGLASFGKRGVPLLVRLLADRQLPVAIEAATALGTNREDPGLAIPALTQALSRRQLVVGAATALAAYRTEARRSIPIIIATEPMNENVELGDDSIESLLSELGPPDAADIPILIACLKLKEPRARDFAAMKLGELGEAAFHAAEALEAAAIATFQEGIAIDTSPRAGRCWPYWEASPYWSAGDECLGAFWKVTRNPKRLIKLFEDCLAIAGKNVFFPDKDDVPEEYRKNVVNPVLQDQQEIIPDDAIPSAGLHEFSRSIGQWSRRETFIDPKGYAARPAEEILSRVKVVWNPPKIDGLGNKCKFSGQLLVTPKGSLALVPVNWLQGIGFCLAEKPGSSPDWTTEINVKEWHGSSVITREGRFEFSVSLKDLKPLRNVAQSFQVGIVLSSFEDDGNRVTVVWNNTQTVHRSSVAMLTIPEAPSLPHELELLNRASGWPRNDGNTVDLINAVNALHRLGKEEALRSLERYLELEGKCCRYPDQTLFWIAALLFEPIRPDELIHVPTTAFLWEEDDVYGQWPLEVVDDIPFILPSRWHPENVEHPRSMLVWASRHAVLREKPLIPRANPLEAAEVVLRSSRIRAYSRGQYDESSLYSNVRNQAIRMTGGLIEPLPRRASGMFATDGEAFVEFIQWQRRRIDAWIKPIRWSEKHNRFIRAT